MVLYLLQPSNLEEQIKFKNWCKLNGIKIHYSSVIDFQYGPPDYWNPKWIGLCISTSCVNGSEPRTLGKYETWTAKCTKGNGEGIELDLNLIDKITTFKISNGLAMRFDQGNGEFLDLVYLSKQKIIEYNTLDPGNGPTINITWDNNKIVKVKFNE